MRKPILKIGLVVTAICLMGFARVATPLPSHHQWHLSDVFARNHSIWTYMSRHFQLDSRYYNNPAVLRRVHKLKKQQYYMYELTRNAQPYIYYVLKQTRKRGMPDEIALIPMIESTYNPFDYSHVGATGLWQLMPGTASGFGLKINWWYDGRRDVVASTNAALNYLQYLHDYFHSWLLAIAAYNSGEGTVINAIRYNRRHGKPTDFWDLPLPYQTKNYVPKLLALAAVIKYHSQYGLRLIPVANQPFFTSITVKKQMSLKKLAKLSDTSEKMIRKLNPGFRRWATMPHHTYHVLIPRNKKQTFLANLDDETGKSVNSTKHNNSKWVYHHVRRGDSLSAIASRYDTSVTALRKMNKLKSNMIRIGENLLIPVAHAETKIKHLSNRKISEDGIPGPKRVEYIVKRHDTISRIAHRYHVTASQIYFWNKFNNHTSLKPGNHLVIWEPRRYYHGSSSHHNGFYHRVRSGETLSGLAHRYGTTVAHLRTANHLSNDQIRIGEKLLIS